MCLNKIALSSEDKAKFEKILIKEMRISLAKESGMPALFAFTLRGAAGEWMLFEVYASMPRYGLYVRGLCAKKQLLVWQGKIRWILNRFKSKRQNLAETSSSGRISAS